jgi:pimeloyl-ACP methyl ester carboxylesterase
MYLIKNNSRIFYDQKGDGKYTFVLLHGTGGSHWQFESVIPLLARSGNVIYLDLRGHGNSDERSEEYKIETYAQDIAWLCEQIAVKNPIFVGLSMGGNIAVEIAASFPHLSQGIVLLDSALLYPSEMLAKMHSYKKGLEGQKYRDIITEIIHNSCLPTDSFRPILLERALQTPQQVWYSSLANMLEWDKTAAAKIQSIRIPVLYVAAAHLIVDLHRFNQLCPQLIIGRTVGSGHINTLGAPIQVSDMLKQFAEKYLRPVD